MGIFFFKMLLYFLILFAIIVLLMSLIQYNEYLVNTVDTDGLVLQHQGISSYSAECAARLGRLWGKLIIVTILCYLLITAATRILPGHPRGSGPQDACESTHGTSHFGDGTKWPPFCRGPLQTHFLEWVLFHFYSEFTKMCPYGSN